MKQKKQGVRAELDDNSGVREVQAVVQESDSPVPAASELEHLHRIRPDLVDHCIREHQIEAEYQRKRFCRIDFFVFAERILGLILAGILTLVAFWVSYLLAISGHEWSACVISGGTLVSIVTAILKRNQSGR